TIRAERAAGRKVAVLVSGDPGLFSLAQIVLKSFGRDQCEIIPGISSVQVALARLGLEWADACILSAHGRTPAIAAGELCRLDKLAILAGTREALQWSAQALRWLGNSHACFLCENLTLPEERIRRLTADELAEVDAVSLAIVILVRRSLLA
ncbi:MAG: precorrin-6y C5,15-methyltransferase (decarboxylating) subunit CbiE, partial [Thermoguttaceae bacterium]